MKTLTAFRAWAGALPRNRVPARTAILALSLAFLLRSTMGQTTPAQGPGEATAVTDARKHYSLALRYYMAGQPHEAIREAKRAVALHPQDNRSQRLLRLLSPDDGDTATGNGWAVQEANDQPVSQEFYRSALKEFLGGKEKTAGQFARVAQALDPGSGDSSGILTAIRRNQTRGHRYRDLSEKVFSGLEDPVLVSGEFRDAPAETVLQAFAHFASTGIVLEGAFGQDLSLQFQNVSPAQALRTVLSVGNFALHEEEGAVILRPQEAGQVETRAFRLWNLVIEGDGAEDSGGDGSSGRTIEQPSMDLNGSPTLEAIRGALSEIGTLLYEPQKRTLIVTDTPDRLKAVERLVRELDKLPAQVLIHARVIEIGVNDLLNLGVDWDLNYDLTMTSSSRPTTFPLFKSFDPFQGVRPGHDPSDTEFPSQSPDGGKNIFPFTTSEDFTFGTISGGDVGFAVNLDSILEKSDILSSPRVLALDGRLAEIQVGDRIPIPTTTTDSETGNVVVVGYEEERVGILLQVVPYVLEGSLIQLHVHPEVSVITGFVGPALNNRPIIATREVTTRVIVKNGATLVLGGLIRDSEILTEDQVPLLSEIPFLGRLFKNRNKDGQKTELMIFITVELVENNTSMSARESQVFDDINPPSSE